VNQPRRGYTLLELVLVVVILALLAVMAIPSLHSAYLQLRLTSATDQIRAAWARGRLQAVNEGRPYRFAIVPNKGNFRLAPDSNDFWTGGSPSSDDPKGDGPIILEAALPKGVRLVMADAGPLDSGNGDDTALPPESVDPGMYQPVVTFLPDGTSREDVGIVFVSQGVAPLLLRLRGLTGAATVTQLDANGQPTNGKP
jgi:prepilin-type N-terminal cleavage/methylation domain-containing protein